MPWTASIEISADIGPAQLARIEHRASGGIRLCGTVVHRADRALCRFHVVASRRGGRLMTFGVGLGGLVRRAAVRGHQGKEPC